jgi:hypothetical protein
MSWINAGPAIGNNFERDLSPLVEATHPGAFDRADVYKNILPGIIRLDKPEAFLTVEPLTVPCVM